MFKFIHAADIHLDSPLLNLEQYDGAPLDTLRVATRDAFDNLVAIAIEEEVRFVLIAGDLYDKDSPDFNTPRHVRNKFRELERNGIEVYIIQGNHDATTIAKTAFQALSLPDNVRVFPTKKPETFLIEDLHVAIHGQGFASRAVAEDLSAAYPLALPGYFNIGLLHTNLGGNQTHDNYAPSTTDGLRSKEYQYWALGHIHKRDKGIGSTKQIIHYPGNTQGRHIRESGEKGCTLVTVDDQSNISMKFRATDVWRWGQCEPDVTGAEHPEDIVVAIRQALEASMMSADERSLAVRVVLKGQSAAHRPLLEGLDRWKHEIRRDAFDVFEDRVWIEKVLVRTRHPLAQVSHQPNEAYGELVAGIHELPLVEDTFADVRDELEKVIKLIPRDVRLDHLRIDLDDAFTVERLVEDAKQLLIARLLSGGLDEQGVA